MIISDKHRFVFLHIPKCAGTSVRRPLSQFNQWTEAGPPWTRDHPDLGLLDYAHIPLFVLRDYFPDAFESVRNYWSFTLLRDPFTRFASSVSERFRMYSDRPIRHRSEAEILTSINQTIDYLSSQPRARHLLPPEYIYFQRQADYIVLDGERVVESVYTVDEVSSLLAEVHSRVDHPWGESSITGEADGRANAIFMFRNDLLRRAYRYTRPLTMALSMVSPDLVKQYLRAWVYVPRDQRTGPLFAADYIREFIREYYAEDIALYDEFRVSSDGAKGA
jgi:hypothetical protein